MSNIVPFPNSKADPKSKPVTKEFNWDHVEGIITYRDIEGHVHSIGFNPWEQSLVINKNSDYLNLLLIELQNEVERDPICHQYVCENIERLIKSIKKTL